jgi:predicted HAD superfamily Cof-like phosphohydrolase
MTGIDFQAAVRDFHRATGAAIGQSVTADLIQLRACLVEEEASEMTHALLTGDMLGGLKEAADVLYVVHGTAVSFGWDLDGAFLAVHRSNMTKLVNGKPLLREDGKVRKGPNYVPPDLRRFLP